MTLQVLGEPVDEPRLGQVVLGRYRVVGTVGRGAQAVIYEAEHLTLKRRVAIKLLLVRSPADREIALLRFQREAEILARLSHPSIAQVFDVDTHAGGLPVMVMELLRGETVRERLARGRPVPWRSAFRLIAQAADGLAVAHEAGVVHRDLKPDNLFLCSDGTLKVLDFGIATRLHRREDEPRPPRLTAVNQVLGTPSYMSPEQLRHVRDLDGRSDLYSLGCVLYNLISGRRVWPRAELPALARLVLTAHPIDIQRHLPTLPDPAARVVRRAMERDRDQRFQTMKQLRAALLAATSTEEDAGVPSGSRLRATALVVEGTTLVDRPPVAVPPGVPTVLSGPTLAPRVAPSRSAGQAPPVANRPTAPSRLRAPLGAAPPLARPIARPATPASRRWRLPVALAALATLATSVLLGLLL